MVVVHRPDAMRAVLLAAEMDASRITEETG
jgi:hypothetical protein